MTTPLRRLWALPSLPPPTSRNLWLALAALVAWQNLWMLHITQEQPKLVLFVVLLWWGALTCMEDRLEQLRPAPSPLSLGLGSLLLLWCLWRSRQIIGLDSVISILTPLEGLALALLCEPLRRLRRFRQQLLILALLPLFTLTTQATAVSSWLEARLSPFAASLAATLLSWLGLEALSDGRLVRTATGSVSVAGACSGIDQIAQVLAIAVIFLLAFPLRRPRHRQLVWSGAVVLPLLLNGARIALLATIAPGPGQTATDTSWWFDFFHEEVGSLLFSGLSVFLFGALYLALIERELGPPPAGPAAPGPTARSQ